MSRQHQALSLNQNVQMKHRYILESRFAFALNIEMGFPRPFRISFTVQVHDLPLLLSQTPRIPINLRPPQTPRSVIALKRTTGVSPIPINSSALGIASHSFLKNDYSPYVTYQMFPTALWRGEWQLKSNQVYFIREVSSQCVNYFRRYVSFKGLHMALVVIALLFTNAATASLNPEHDFQRRSWWLEHISLWNRGYRVPERERISEWESNC